MNIKTFENELNPEFINKARNIYILARSKNCNLKIDNNEYTFDSLNNTSKVKLDSNLNVIESSCDCHSRFLYCEHSVANFFAIKEYLLKGNNYSNVNNDENIINFINDLDSITMYLPNHIYYDLQKLLKIISKEEKKEEYINHYLSKINERYKNKDLFIANIASLIRQIDLSLVIIFLRCLHNYKYNLSFVISELINNGFNEENLFDIFKNLNEDLMLDILYDNKITKYNAFDKTLNYFNYNSLEYITFNLIKKFTNFEHDSYLVNKYINDTHNDNIIHKILLTLLNSKKNITLNDDELNTIIYFGLKYAIKLDHILDTFDEDTFNKYLEVISLSTLNNNDVLTNNFSKLIKDNINKIISNELINNRSNYPLTSKSFVMLNNKIKDLCIFEIETNSYDQLIIFVMDHYLVNDEYLVRIEEYEYIYFSRSNARVYLIRRLSNFINIVKYDYLLESIDNNFYEEIDLPYHLLDKYNDYLLEIKDLIPSLQKEKKLKQLNNFQNYLLSSLITNEVKNDIKVELSLNTKKRFIKKEELSLRLKLGNNKYYYINNLAQFFYNIKENKTQSFGKNTTFNLNTNNFNEHSLELVSELSTLINNEINKNLLIDTNVTQKIFDIYKNKNIEFTYRNETYNLKVNEVEIEPNINIDEHGTLSSNELSNNSIIISSLSKDYLLDFNKLLISKLKYKNEKIKNVIYFLIKNNNNFETNDIQDKFNEVIYPLIYDNAIIDEKYKLNNPIKLLEINCYLDIDENNVISVESKYFFDNNEIYNFDDIMKEKVNNYLKLLTLLGFDKEYKISDPDLVGDFLKKDLSSLKDIAKVYISEDLKQKKIINFNSYNVYLRQNNNMLNVVFSQSQFSDDELYLILKAFKRKKKYAFLKGKVIEIDKKVSEELINIIEDFNLDEKHLSKEVNNPFYNILKVNNYYELNSFKIESELKEIINEIFNYKEAKYSPNNELYSIMRPYQIEAYKWLKILNKYNLGGILADDMGLGKTIETIALLDDVKSEFPSIIISPKSLIYNWESELNKWPTSLIPYVISGNKNERKEILNNNFKGGNVFIISYDTLRNDLDLFTDKTFNYAILDEAQTIKNMQALKTKSVKKLEAMHRLVLTGTPIENSVADLWSIFDFLMPNYLFNYDRFRVEIEKGILMNDDEAYKRIIQKTKPFILRRTKKDVLKDLPDKIEETILINMNTEQRKVYDAHLMQTKKALMSNDNNKIQVLSMLTRLRQLCISPSLVYDNDIESEKINYTLQMIENLIETDHKVLIFSQFVSALNLIQKELINKDIPYFMISGDTNSKRRLEMSNEFNKDTSKEKVFLISLKAGGTGLNLVGADTVIHLDPWWNVAIEDQASDRAHRLGQERKVTVFKLVMKDSIEEKVIELQKNKKEIANRIISQNDKDSSLVTFEDYEYLLS